MHIAVFGAGSWGTALARMLARKGKDVRLWVYEKELVDEIKEHRVNTWYLDGFELPTNLQISDDKEWVLEGAEMLVLVTPSQVMRQIIEPCEPLIVPDLPVVCCSKGIEISTGKLMSDVLAEALPRHEPKAFTFLSGPSFAKEVALEHPTAVVIAGEDQEVCKKVQDTFRTPFFMTFTHNDVAGVEVGGALKNVMAIATGIVDGLGLGNNTRAALITRGLYEMIKISNQAFSAEPLSFVGLAGMGDLILTCTGGLSRNRKVGVLLGEGKTIEEVLGGMKMVAEGVKTTKAVYELIVKHNITAPICTAMYQIIYEGKTPQDAVSELTAMELKGELSSILTNGA